MCEIRRKMAVYCKQNFLVKQTFVINIVFLYWLKREHILLTTEVRGEEKNVNINYVYTFHCN